MRELIVPAQLSELDRVIEFVKQQMEEYQCPQRIMIQMEIAVEEIYVNIAHYAYPPPGEGYAAIRCEILVEPLQVVIQFLDNGKPYNPLEKQDPDITQGADEREVGGLGIFMVKKSMDDIEYSYKDGKNILTIKKKIK